MANWIKGAVHPERKGLFTKKAKKHGMGVQEYASKVKSGKVKADKTTLHEALFAAAMKSIAKKRKGKK